MKKLIFLLFFLIQSSAYAGWLWGPDNFEECVAENIKTVSSETAAKAINMACRGLFPEKKYENYEQCVSIKEKEKKEKEKEKKEKEKELSIGQREGESLASWLNRTRGLLSQRESWSLYTSINPESDCRTYFPTEETKKYYKCLLKNMKGVSTDTAAKVIIINCKKKHLKN